ncbi:pyrrolo-quinoline quinone [Clostridium sp. D2Q-11]|uniref:Pyrrolo-quinoline quinone n=1 Tax=Anaeromonas frigoriresistens TaxID=2683708 RepID=A0A942UQ37_9FIRM|nr:pyrrolo-quinoline quinone [Anaeromonas frigoriresistens]MBS4537123.1 pyrrolo-quinoline quinone [Anaeromonas frigoriresistens]
MKSIKILIIILSLVFSFLFIDKGLYLNASKEHPVILKEDTLIESISYRKKLKFNWIMGNSSSNIDLKQDDSIDQMVYSFENESILDTFINDNRNIRISNNYTNIEGILSFRGNNLRDLSSFNISNMEDETLKKAWTFETSLVTGNHNKNFGPWGGGVGWTGQPTVIKWERDIKNIMNIKDKFKNKENFSEVIIGSLDGKIYFIDLDTGEETRKPIDIGNPIKGTVTLDPRGYPLLYVGQGVPEVGSIGYRIYSLIDGKLLHFINGKDNFAIRKWGAFDSSPLIIKESDVMVLGGENGLLYIVKLNTDFDIKTSKINVNPKIIKFKYQVKGSYYPGIESSISGYKNLIYWPDNSGNITCFDLSTMEPKWVWNGMNKDDTNTTIVLEVINDKPFLYIGSELDKQQNKTKGAYFKKLDGLSGDVLWENKYDVFSGGSYSNGGIYSTAVLGDEDMENLVVYNVARVNKANQGIMVAVDKNSGEEMWRWNMKNYPWSSPISFYNNEGKGYLIQCDSLGRMWLINGKTGDRITNIDLEMNIEASPIFYNDMIIVGSRGNKIYGIKVE